jgi:hypothetical protein
MAIERLLQHINHMAGLRGDRDPAGQDFPAGPINNGDLPDLGCVALTSTALNVAEHLRLVPFPAVCSLLEPFIGHCRQQIFHREAYPTLLGHFSLNQLARRLFSDSLNPSHFFFSNFTLLVIARLGSSFCWILLCKKTKN